MLSQEENRGPVFFSVVYRPFDGAAQNGSLLAQIRGGYFASPRTLSGKLRSVENGMECRTRYRMGRDVFDWLKTGGKTVLQRAYRERDGYSLLTWNAAGELTGKARFGRGHEWLQTCYYSGDAAKPEALLRPSGDGGLVLLRLDPERQKYARILLRPCPYRAGSAEESLVDAVAGEPEVCAETDAGSFCYCEAEQAARREAVWNDLNEGVRALRPDWPEEREAELSFQYIVNDGSVPEAEPEPEPEVVLEQEPESGPEPRKEPDYPANHELYSVDEPDPPAKYTVAAKGLGGRTQFSSALVPGSQQTAKRIVVSGQENYLYFGRVIDGLRQGRGRTQMQNGHTAYEGGYADDHRDGFGVYYYKSGKLCYAGDWKQNRRDGVGVAFSSKDGSVFVGRWKDNIPTGSGAAFDAQGNLIYTGEWKNGRRHGHGTEFRDGKIVFSGEFRDDRYVSGYRRVEGEDRGE